MKEIKLLLAFWVITFSTSAQIGILGWELQGNSGTTEGVNFTGTTDSMAFDIRTNNTIRTRITTKGQIEIFNTGQSVFLGEGAGAIDDLTDNQNSFIGFQTGFSNTTGYHNAAYGFRSLYSNTTGYQNTANGYRSLYSNTTGNYNTAMGNHALYNNTTGQWNTAIGQIALYFNTTGQCNTANGHWALHHNTSGYLNTAIGHRSMYENLSGINNTALGSYAFITGQLYSNSTAVGYLTYITASNQVRVGANNVVTSIGGPVGWTTVSDSRFKKDINETVPGLAFINKLRPVTYHMDIDRMAAFLKIPDSLRSKEAEAIKGGMLQTGFIAQEVEKAALELGFEFSGVDQPKNENDYYGLRYAEFTVPLVKAVQEQQKMIEALKLENEGLKEDIAKIKALLEGTETSQVAKITSNNTVENTISVFPNPVSDNFNITFSPSQNGNYVIELFDMRGNLLLHTKYSVTINGENVYNLSMNNYANGIYLLKVFYPGNSFVQEVKINKIN